VSTLELETGADLAGAELAGAELAGVDESTALELAAGVEWLHEANPKRAQAVINRRTFFSIRYGLLLLL
jgi:hypothetical protein